MRQNITPTHQPTCVINAALVGNIEPLCVHDTDQAGCLNLLIDSLVLVKGARIFSHFLLGKSGHGDRI